MEKIDQLDKKRVDLVEIIDQGRDLIEEIKENLRKKNSKIDMLNYKKLNKKASLADKIILSKSNMDDRRINNLYNNYLEEARNYLDLNKVLTGGMNHSSLIRKPKYRINLDLKMRGQKFSQQRQIRDIQRINRYLYLEAEKIKGQIELIEIDNKMPR